MSSIKSVNSDHREKYELLKSNYDNITCNSISQDTNKVYFYSGIPTTVIFNLQFFIFFIFFENSVYLSDTTKLTTKEVFILDLMRF